MGNVPGYHSTASMVRVYINDMFRHTNVVFEQDHLQATKKFLHGRGENSLRVQKSNSAPVRHGQSLLFHHESVHHLWRLERPGVETEREQCRLVVQLPTNGRQQGHSARWWWMFQRPEVPGVLLFAKKATVPAALNRLRVKDASVETSPVFPFLVAHLYLTDVENEFVNSISKFGREPQQG